MSTFITRLPDRLSASAPWWCCSGPGPSGARPGSCNLSFTNRYWGQNWWLQKMRFGKLSNVEIDEKSLHIRKFLYVCRWCEAVQEFNYLKMTRKWSCPWYLMQMRDIGDDEKNVDDENRLCIAFAANQLRHMTSLLPCITRMNPPSPLHHMVNANHQYFLTSL